MIMLIIRLKSQQLLILHDKNIQIMKSLRYSNHILLQERKHLLGEFADSLNLADKVYLCEIFGSARENQGKLSIEDLQEKIPGAELIKEDKSILQKHENSVILFMGAGDIQKFQVAYEHSLQVK